MRKPVALLLALVALWGLCVPTASAQLESEFLLLIYLCGTDLESDDGAASSDLLEMIDAEVSPDSPLTVLVQAGGAKKWQGGFLENGECQRFIVADDLYAIGDSLGPVDMGEPDALRDFVRFALDAYPARRTALVLWDHGAGATGGICYDEITGNSLTAAELRDALSQALSGREERLAFIGFDACLMSAFEVAIHLKPFADFMVASEELEPGSGWAYDRWLRALAEDPAMDTEEIGRNIVDSFIESALTEDSDDYVTLAVTDLQQMDSLVRAVEDFGQTLAQALDRDQFSAISRARAQMRAFGDFAEASSDMVDIAEAAWYCRRIAPEAAKMLAQAVKEAVVYSRNSANIQSAGGLSILLPEKTKADADVYMPAYDSLSLMPGYSDFVAAYLEQLIAGSHSFSPAAIHSIALDASDEESAGWLSGFVQGLSENAPQAGGWLEDGQDAAQQPSMSAEEYAQVAEAYGNSAYSVELSADDLENLSYVEAALLQDAQGMVDAAYGDEVYFDYGLVQDIYVDWESGVIYGLFNGNWPTLEGQMVVMYDQTVSEEYTRSLIPALVNGEAQYLLVVFNEANPYGSVIGYSEGYDSNGNPFRGHHKLKPGDTIVPTYDLIYWDASEEMLTDTFLGEEIVVGSTPLQFGYEPVEPGDYNYAFCLNDVYGDYQYTDFAELCFE